MFGGIPQFLVLVGLDILLMISWIFNMKHRSELLQVYSNFAKIVETQFFKHIKIFRSYNALKYSQYAFQIVLYSYDTIH